MTVPEFQLIETILYDPAEGYFLLEAHLERLSGSADFFGFRFDARKIIEALERAVSDPEPRGRLRVRLLLLPDGGVTITSEPPVDIPGPRRTALSGERVDSGDIFLRHKTTRRELFDAKITACRQAGLYDALFLNERGELTEGAWNNLVIEKDGEMFTPPTRCGLLNGVFRRGLVESARTIEKVLFPDDLLSAESIYLCNSVRGLVSVEFDRSIIV